jgi:hypothetical protein
MNYWAAWDMGYGAHMASFLVVKNLLTGHEPGLVTSSPTMRKFDKVRDKMRDKAGRGWGRKAEDLKA